MMCNAFLMLPSSSNENRASTSVDTLPGTIFKISLPNCTSKLSNVESTCSSSVLPCFLPYATASSRSLAYSGFFAAANIRLGLVVASCGLYLSMVAKSPLSQTTVYQNDHTYQPWPHQKDLSATACCQDELDLRCQWPSTDQETKACLLQFQCV